MCACAACTHDDGVIGEMKPKGGHDHDDSIRLVCARAQSATTRAHTSSTHGAAFFKFKFAVYTHSPRARPLNTLSYG